MATSAASRSPRGRSANRKRTRAQDALLDTRLEQGFSMAVDLALDWLVNPTIPPYVKVKAMDFFARNRPEKEGGAEPASDPLLALMSEISVLNDAEGLPPNASPAA